MTCTSAARWATALVGRDQHRDELDRAARARSAASCSPASTSLASQTSRVSADVVVSRPPAWRSRALRWRRTRSTSVRSGVEPGLGGHERRRRGSGAARRAPPSPAPGRRARTPRPAARRAGPGRAAGAGGSPGSGCGRSRPSSASISSSRPSRSTSARTVADRRPLAHQRLGRCAPERAERGQVADGLEQVGLALAVRSDDGGEPGRRTRHRAVGVERKSASQRWRRSTRVQAFSVPNREIFG